VLLVDTSVWSLAFRRDHPPDDPRVDHLRHELVTGGDVVTTGIIVQELLQGTRGPKQRELLLDRLRAIALVEPGHRDHVRAADVHATCRRRGVQLGTIDALIAALCVGHDLTLLTADRDFDHAAKHVPLRIWSP
jgi:predicted nucleic acid-binding protein